MLLEIVELLKATQIAAAGDTARVEMTITNEDNDVRGRTGPLNITLYLCALRCVTVLGACPMRGLLLRASGLWNIAWSLAAPGDEPLHAAGCSPRERRVRPRLTAGAILAGLHRSKEAPQIAR